MEPSSHTRVIIEKRSNKLETDFLNSDFVHVVLNHIGTYFFSLNSKKTLTDFWHLCTCIKVASIYH